LQWSNNIKKNGQLTVYNRPDFIEIQYKSNATTYKILFTSSMPKLPHAKKMNFRINLIDSHLLDCCGQLQFYFAEYPKIKIKFNHDNDKLLYIKDVVNHTYNRLIKKCFTHELANFIIKYVETFKTNKLYEFH